MKTAKIDLVLGDGSGRYTGDLEENDSIDEGENYNDTETNDEF